MLQSILYPPYDDILVQEERSIFDSIFFVLVLADWLEAGGTVSMIVLEMTDSHIHISVNELPLGQKFQWEVITRGLFNSPLLLSCF